MWYIHDIFVLFTSPEHLEDSRNFLNGRHANMSFVIEYEKQKRRSFLDVMITCEDKTFLTSFYYKPTFSGVYTHFESLLPSTYNFGIAYTVAYRYFRILTKLHTELVCLKKIHKKWLP